MKKIEEISFDFAIKIVKTYQILTDHKKEFIMSKQLLRSGTSIGANVSEAQYAQSKADFISKMSIALKESSETTYWLKLLRATDYISNEDVTPLLNDLTSIKNILTAIIRTSKESQ